MGGTEQTTTESKPMPFILEVLENLAIPNVEKMFDRKLEFFDQPAIAGEDASTSEAARMAQGLGEKGYRRTSEDFIQSLIGGDFSMGANDAALTEMSRVMGDKTMEQYQRITSPGIASRFASAGRSGSDAMGLSFGNAQRNLAEGLQRANAEIYLGQANRDLDRRMSGLGAAQGLDAMDRADIASLFQIGQMREQRAQRGIDVERQKFDFYQMEPEGRIDRLLQRLGQGNMGMGTQTTTSPDNTGLSIGMGLMGMAGSLGGGYLAGR